VCCRENAQGPTLNFQHPTSNAELSTLKERRLKVEDGRIENENEVENEDEDEDESKIQNPKSKIELGQGLGIIGPEGG
jgi:hypothetical protein